MKKRTLSLLLIIAMLAANSAACGSTDAPAADGTAAADDTPAAQTTADPNARDTSDLPDTNLGGFNLRVLLATPTAAAQTMYIVAPDEENGDVLNDAVFRRTSRTGEKYGFTVENIYAAKVQDTLKTSVLAGDDEFDVALPQIPYATPLITQGILRDLYDVENLNLKKNYWDQNFARDLSIAGKLYFASGDILVSDDDNIVVTLYNTAMAEDYKLPSLYEEAYAGKWTFERMMSLIKDVAQDVDGDGKLNADEDHTKMPDTVGLLYANNNCVAPYFASAGVYLVTKDENDLPVLGQMTDRMSDMYDKMMIFLDESRFGCNWMHFKDQVAAITTMVENKQALFQNMILSQIRRLYRDVKTDFGILPIPKFDEKQEKYATSIWKYFEVITIPVTTKNTDKIGFAVEALAAASDTLTEAYYDICLNSKYTRDEESFDMINLTRENVIYDVGAFYDWGKMYSSITQAAANTDGALASLIDSYKSAAEAEVKDYVDAVKALD